MRSKNWRSKNAPAPPGSQVAQLTVEPLAQRDVEAALVALDDGARQEFLRQLPQQELRHALAELQPGGNAGGELQQEMIYERRPHFE
jgi:hypothetical protein